MYKLTNDRSDEIRIILNNLDRLLEAISLIVVSVFAYLEITCKVDGSKLNWLGYHAVLVACVIIALRGSWEMLRFLREK